MEVKGMKITKFPQSCLLIEANNKKILVDPGNLKFKEEYFDVWNSVDVIFVTHKHPDHCNIDVLERLNKNITIYSTNEVAKTYKNLNIKIINEKDVIERLSVEYMCICGCRQNCLHSICFYCHHCCIADE